MAKLYFRYGAMSSGKTLDLLKVYYNYKEKGMSTLVIKPLVDTKGDSDVISRVGSRLRVNFLVDDDDNIYDIVQNEILKKRISCILVDEAQFLLKKHVDQLSDVVDLLDIPVICYGLRADFRGDLFEGSKRLFEISDSIEELKTVCDCGKKAIWNVRYVNNAITFKGSQIAIDNTDNVTYKSMCRKCMKKLRERK